MTGTAKEPELGEIVLGLLVTIWEGWKKRKVKKVSSIFCRKGPASTRS